MFQFTKVIFLTDVQIVPYWPMAASSSQCQHPFVITLEVFGIFLDTWDKRCSFHPFTIQDLCNICYCFLFHFKNEL